MVNFPTFISVLGKVLFITLIIVATHFHLLAGIILILLLIIMRQTVSEGMTTMNESSSKDSKDSKTSKNSKEISNAVSTFKSEHCKNGKLMLNDKEITSDIIKNSFPNIKFSDKSCNPCDEDCGFEIVSSNEQLTVEENLRPKESNSQPVDHEKSITKRE